MIEQVLDRAFLISVVERLQASAAAPDSDDRRGVADMPDPLDGAILQSLMVDLQTARSSATDQSGAERRSQEEPQMSAADRRIFISSSPEMSNLQSAIEEHCYTRRPDLVASNGESSDRGGGGASSFAGAQLLGINAEDDLRRLFGPFEQTDLRWISSLFAAGMTKFRKKHRFVPRPVRKVAIGFPDENVRMIVFGDWGSGIPRATQVSDVIRRELEDGKAKGLQQHVIHLGDVYYSGWKREYEERLLRDWPVRVDEKEIIGSFNLNGNHDMFSGGHDYYEVGLADERFVPWQGKSSLFHLSNSRWQLFGLDSSWEEASLAGDQAQWVLEAAVRGKKTMLLSHHQFCSSYEKASESLIEAATPMLQGLDVAAWLWGHEHRCETFREVAGIRFPRCLGHAGVPVYQTHGKDDPVPAPGEWEYRDWNDGGPELWARFGFCTLDFHGDTIAVRYVNEDGGVDHKETLR